MDRDVRTMAWVVYMLRACKPEDDSFLEKYLTPEALGIDLPHKYWLNPSVQYCQCDKLSRGIEYGDNGEIMCGTCRHQLDGLQMREMFPHKCSDPAIDIKKALGLDT